MQEKNLIKTPEKKTMAKKKKQKSHQKTKKQIFTNSPFQNLKQQFNIEDIQTKDREQKQIQDEHEPQSVDEQDILLDIISGTVPLEKKHTRVSAAKKINIEQLNKNKSSAHIFNQPAELSRFKIENDAGYISGIARDVDRRLLKRLKKGEYPIDAKLDLHFLKLPEAESATIKFIQQSFSISKRCLLIIHGRGLGSKDHVPILKENISYWITGSRAGQYILAFATARPEDGGDGAIYVLLKKQPRL